MGNSEVTTREDTEPWMVVDVEVVDVGVEDELVVEVLDSLCVGVEVVVVGVVDFVVVVVVGVEAEVVSEELLDDVTVMLLVVLDVVLDELSVESEDELEVVTEPWLEEELDVKVMVVGLELEVVPVDTVLVSVELSATVDELALAEVVPTALEWWLGDAIPASMAKEAAPTITSRITTAKATDIPCALLSSCKILTSSKSSG